MLLIDLPLIVASFWSISAFYVIAQRELYPKNWKRRVLLLPVLMAVGVALTMINTRAVLEALFGVQTAFARTPKYAIGGGAVKLENKKYRRRSGWLPYAEIAVGTLLPVDGGFRHRNLELLRGSVPAAVCAGYYWAGFSTLYEEHQSRLHWLRAAATGAERGAAAS